MRIYGIDASLSSTGVCMLDANFKQSHATTLMEILLDVYEGHCQHEQADEFNDAVSIGLMTQIQPPKTLVKELAKVRKKMRDDSAAGEVSFEDLRRENNMIARRIRYQVDEILRYHKILCPSLTMIEDYSFHSNGSLVQLAEMKGYLKGVSTPVILTAPIVSVKKVGSTKGNGTKKAMFEGIQRFPFYNLKIDEKRDDEIDALAICLTAFFSIYHRTIGIPFPKGENTKEKSRIKSWIKCLDTFADHIGTSTEMRGMIDAKRF